MNVPTLNVERGTLSCIFQLRFVFPAKSPAYNDLIAIEEKGALQSSLVVRTSSFRPQVDGAILVLSFVL